MQNLIISDEVLQEKFEELGFDLDDEILSKCKEWSSLNNKNIDANLTYLFLFS